MSSSSRSLSPPPSNATVAILGLVVLVGAGCREAPESGAGGPNASTPPSTTGSEVLEQRARGLLASERPWQAARVMEQYGATAGPLTAEDRVLAARAEAGWGDWAAVEALLGEVEQLGGYDDGVGLYLLGRAHDERGDPAGAARRYRRFLELAPAAAGLETQRAAARLRLALAHLASGEAADSLLGTVRASLATAEPWLDVLVAGALARTGDTAAVRQIRGEVSGRILELWARRAHIEAAGAAGDAALMRSLANEARRWARTDGTDAEFMLGAGAAALALGDTAAARDAFRATVALAPASRHARDAAEALFESPSAMSAADHLAVARVDVARGLHGDALPHFEAWLAAPPPLGEPPDEVGHEYARALFYADRPEAALDVLDDLRPSSAVQRLRARTLALLGDTGAAASIYRDLARDGGTLDLFLAADTWHDAGEYDRARPLYRQLLDRAPGSDRAGLTMMRLAGMAFEAGDLREAGRIWADYRGRYPRGERALQATYWLGRVRERQGDTAAARALFREIRDRQRDSYYALLASERLGEPFWPLPMSPSPVTSPEAVRQVAEWMRGIDVLREAGFEEAAEQEAIWVRSQVGPDRGLRLALGEALAERGYGRSAILLGLGLRTSEPPSRRLLQLLFPFPYRTLISASATDREIEPMVAAALIRQESMFEARITSHVGARGLMQIMPATARELAREIDLERWDPELLYRPEMNVHLGTLLLARHIEEYEGFLPAVFGAYNAGAHRITRWQRFPSWGDAELFTERIPYTETRDYVKILTRNRAIYEGLWGSS